MKGVFFVLLVLSLTLSALFAYGLDSQAESNQPEQSGETVLQMPVALSKPEVSAHVKYSIIGPDGKQTVYVRVTDQEGHGLANMDVNLVIRGMGAFQMICAQPTNALGHTSCSFVAPNLPAGPPVFVDAIVAWQGQQIKARTSYITW